MESVKIIIHDKKFHNIEISDDVKVCFKHLNNDEAFVNDEVGNLNSSNIVNIILETRRGGTFVNRVIKNGNVDVVVEKVKVRDYRGRYLYNDDFLGRWAKDLLQVDDMKVRGIIDEDDAQNRYERLKDKFNEYWCERHGDP